MAKMKYWNGTTWEILDAKDADTVDGKHAAATLTTTEKNDLAGAINEVKSSVNVHLADNANPHQVKAEQVFALGGVPAGTTFPTSPAPYTLFFRTDFNKLFVYLP